MDCAHHGESAALRKRRIDPAAWCYVASIKAKISGIKIGMMHEITIIIDKGDGPTLVHARFAWLERSTLLADRVSRAT
jgi:hypothetical protein